jgi:hypothetical protein
MSFSKAATPDTVSASNTMRDVDSWLTLLLENLHTEPKWIGLSGRGDIHVEVLGRQGRDLIVGLGDLGCFAIVVRPDL